MRLHFLTSLFTFLAATCYCLQAEQNTAYLSLRLEVERAIKLGNQYLTEQANEDGSWSDPEHPALTALVLTALHRSPQGLRPPQQDQSAKGLQWLCAQQQADGGVYTEGLATYNTATAIMAWLATGERQYHEAILKARAFLIGQQTDWGTPQSIDTPYDGGVGYGGTYKHSDLSNTHLALEALYHTQALALDRSDPQPQLNWGAALQFITRCQNLSATNDQAWATAADDQERGGFVYFPGDSKAGKKAHKDQPTALRSYGSMSYAGLLSLIYADLAADDERVVAALEWLGANFSVTENPGMQQQGLYYYYQAMAKCLATAGCRELMQTDGTRIDWRRQLGSQLVSQQREDGSWLNATSRWWENDPILVTAYAVLALEQLHQTL